MRSGIHRSVATFTRPNNTTAYAAGDSISDSATTPTNMTFADVTDFKGGGCQITSVLVSKSGAGVTNCDFDLVLYDTAPTAFEDNAAWDPSDAEAKRIVAIIAFANGDAATSANNATWQRSVLDADLRCVAGSRALYGGIVARGAWTPTALEVFTVTLFTRTV